MPPTVAAQMGSRVLHGKSSRNTRNAHTRGKKEAAAERPIEFPWLMFVVAILIDGIQAICSIFFAFTALIPVLGLAFTFLGFLINIIFTIFVMIFFVLWAKTIGLGKNVSLSVLFVLLGEFFSAGILPGWTLFVARMKHTAQKENKKQEKTNEARGVLRA